MKLTSMIALAVKWTVNERIEECAEWGEAWQERERRYKKCLSDAFYTGDTVRYKKLLATRYPDC